MRVWTADAIKNLIRKMLREEGWPAPVVITIGPDCEPRMLADD